MMMCQTDTNQEVATTDSQVNNSQLPSRAIKEESTSVNYHHSDVDSNKNFTSGELTHESTGHSANIKTDHIKQECESQQGTFDTETSVIEHSNDLDSFRPYDHNDQCEYNPEFAVICSFISQYGDKLDMMLDIEQLKTSIEDQSRVDESLIDLHVKLLKKIRRYFVRDLWERALIRYVSEYSYEDAYELERLGYQKTRPSIKLQLLRRLMDAQFEHDQKFKAAVNLCEADSLRILATGRDNRGRSYWHQSDKDGNLRVYQEHAMDHKSWKTVCSNVTELSLLIEELEKEKDEKTKGEPILEPYNPFPEIFPELFVKEEIMEEEKPSETKVSKTKKGRNKGRGKKNEPLPVLKELDDENSNFERNMIVCNEKVEDQPSRTLLSSLKVSNNGTDESQIKSTLDNLIDKVVSSFEFIIRPLSRNHLDLPKEEVGCETRAPPKKRATKRNKPKEEVLPRRSSSRIQLLQEKKIAEQEEELKKMIETNAAKKANSVTSMMDDDSRSRSISSRTNRKRSESPENDVKKNGKKRRRKGQSWKRGKGKKKLSWDKDDSDLSSASSVTESNDEDDLDFEEEAFKMETNDLDDEFACEDEDTNVEPVIIKRARTARQNTEQDDLNESSILEEDKPCGRCDKSNDPEWILLCDMCDDGYHTSCCLPPLMIVPDGDWFCPPCEHKMLMTKLRELHTSITELLEIKERELKKAQRLRNVKKEPVKIENTEVSEKRQRDFLSELNEPLALQALDDELEEESDPESDYSYKRKPRSRTKKNGLKKATNKRPVAKRDDGEFSIDYGKTRKTYSRRKVSEDEESDDDLVGSLSHYSSEEEDESEKEEEEEVPKTRRARASVSYRFQEYDELIKSAIQGDSYDDDDPEEEEEKESERESSPESQGNYGRGKDMATIEALAYQQENGLNGPSSEVMNSSNTETLPVKPKAKPRKKARRLNDLDAASESGNTTSDESFQASSATEAEDDDITEAEISDETDTSIDELVNLHGRSKNKKRVKQRRRSYDSDDSDYEPTRTTRRAASKRVSYKESTEDEDSETITTVKKKKNVLSSGEESEASWKSDASVGKAEDDADDDVDDKSTSCPDSPETEPDLIINEGEKVYSPVEPEHSQKTQVPMEKPIPEPEPGPPLPPIQQAKHSSHTTIAKDVINTESPNLPQSSSHSVGILPDESFDEIATPFYTHDKSTPTKYTSMVVDTAAKPEQQGPPKLAGNERGRDPIKELIQYCNESANSASMFNSYNQTLSTRNHPVPGDAQPTHPPFYGEDDLK